MVMLYYIVTFFNAQTSCCWQDNAIKLTQLAGDVKEIQSTLAGLKMLEEILAKRAPEPECSNITIDLQDRGDLLWYMERELSTANNISTPKQQSFRCSPPKLATHGTKMFNRRRPIFDRHPFPATNNPFQQPSSWICRDKVAQEATLLQTWWGICFPWRRGGFPMSKEFSGRRRS